MENYNDIRYLEAERKVKKIRSFYIHLLVFVIINLMIAIINIQGLKPGESYFHLHNFHVLIFWGIGLACHAMSVFLPNFFLGNEWEQKKIKELMEKEKSYFK